MTSDTTPPASLPDDASLHAWIDEAFPKASQFMREHETAATAVEADSQLPQPPEGYALATPEQRQCLPEGSIFFNEANGKWRPSSQIGESSYGIGLYACPIQPQPWSLPAPPPGRQWHRTDWTQEMLPEGTRPLLLGEWNDVGDEILPAQGGHLYGEGWQEAETNYQADENTWHLRTRRPLPEASPQSSQPAERQANQYHFAKLYAAMSQTDPKGQAGAGKPTLGRQEGGSHYKDYPIQPVEFINANKLTFLEGCVVKRICRHRRKNGAEDIRKAIHELELILALEYPETLVDDRPPCGLTPAQAVAAKNAIEQKWMDSITLKAKA